ncbi:tetratricopeptide repeat protein [Marinihelvus fidelis]|uniref:Tetratricopeptide repeat protein n=2 Tax=Marinihelvus fidelis TaxID=2613842 RepID=A0A5N0T539_9GAMM|nr:tetratricopeptide repeat protein [Marinihelvus fidelis]
MSRISHPTINRVRAWLSILLASGLLQACATTAGPASGKDLNMPPPVPDSLRPHSAITGPFGPKPAMPAPNELFALTDAQVDEFMAFMDGPQARQVPRHRRLYDFIEAFSQDFNYQDDTLGAGLAMTTGSGNCLSLAILTTALARVAGIEIGYQLVSDAPVYEMDGQVILKGVHVRSQLYDPAEMTPGALVIANRARIIIDYFPTGRERFVANLDERQFIAMYYRNIAAQALGDDDLGRAYWYAHESLRYAPDHEAAINTLAVAHRRIGDPMRAEELYLYGVENADNKLSLLKNYRVLLASQGRVAEARQVEARLSRMEDPSPFNWLQLARDASDEGQFDDAVRFYNRALELAPYMHEGYAGMAQAHYAAGEVEQARQAMDEAIRRTMRVSTREAYEGKLAALKAKSDLL